MILSFYLRMIVMNSTVDSKLYLIPLGLAQLTLLTVTEVTVVPAVWLMVLGVIPGTGAPTEL